MSHWSPRRISRFGRASVIGLVSLSVPLQAFAAGSNTSPPAQPPFSNFSQVTTSQQTANIAAATCAQQLTTLGVVAQGTAIGLELGGLGAEIGAQAAGIGPTQQAAEAAAIGLQVGAQG